MTAMPSVVTPALSQRFLFSLIGLAKTSSRVGGFITRLGLQFQRKWWLTKTDTRSPDLGLFNSTSSANVTMGASLSKLFRALLLGLILGVFIIYLSLVYFVVPLGTWLFTVFTLLGVSYTLLSGFVYFTTRLGFGRNTDIGQRFWKRSFSIFWLLEFGLFGSVVYLTLISPSEVGYSYDTPAVFKTHFFSLPDFFFRAVIFSAMLLCLSVMLGLNYRSRTAFLWYIHALVSVLFCLLLYIEIGIFQGYLNYVGFYKWLINVETYEHTLETELARSRVLHGFVLLASIVKFWHFIVIAVVWFFYLARYFEYEDTRAALLNSVFQSFLILYGLNFLMLAPYLKYLGRKYMSNPYYWFFETPDFNSLWHAIEFTKIFYLG